LNRASIIQVEANNSNTIIQYLNILDKINQGLLEIRNELCLDRLNLEYRKLNLKSSKERKIKNAIDLVYPVKIAPISYQVPPPPPPPLSQSIKY